jgi:hypothetical protein
VAVQALHVAEESEDDVTHFERPRRRTRAPATPKNLPDLRQRGLEGWSLQMARRILEIMALEPGERRACSEPGKGVQPAKVYLGHTVHKTPPSLVQSLPRSSPYLLPFPPASLLRNILCSLARLAYIASQRRCIFSLRSRTDPRVTDAPSSLTRLLCGEPRRCVGVAGTRVPRAAWWLDSSPHAASPCLLPACVPSFAHWCHAQARLAMALITVTHQNDVQQQLQFKPGRRGQAMYKVLVTAWGEGFMMDASGIVIAEDEENIPAGDYSFCPGAYLICP